MINLKITDQPQIILILISQFLKQKIDCADIDPDLVINPYFGWHVTETEGGLSSYIACSIILYS